MTNSISKSYKKYSCDCCDYTCLKLSHFKYHMSSIKHAKNNKIKNNITDEDGDKIIDFEQFRKIFYPCDNCEKEYQNRVSIWRHKKTCGKKNTIDNTVNNTVNNTVDSTNVIKYIIIRESDILPPIQPIQVVKKRKKNIKLSLKRQVWCKYVGREKGMTKCMCCKIIDIDKDSFVCGHIIAESKGGETVVNNLKPICSSCNSSMGNENMDDFIEKYKLNEFIYNETGDSESNEKLKKIVKK